MTKLIYHVIEVTKNLGDTEWPENDTSDGIYIVALEKLNEDEAISIVLSGRDKSRDEGNGIGAWCSGTFSELPQLSSMIELRYTL